MQDRFDGLKIGMLVSEAFLNQGNINSSAIGKEYDLKLRLDLTAQSVGVLNVGIDDDTSVFEVVETFNQQAVNNQTNLTQKTKVYDSNGEKLITTLANELQISEKTRVAGGMFNGTTPDTNFYTTSSVANGSATIANSVLTLATTTDANSSIFVYTNSKARYIGGCMNHLRFNGRVGDTGTTNNTRIAGVTEDSTLANSIYFQLNGTMLSLVVKTSGLADVVVNNGSFNGEQAAYTLTGNFATWEIYYTNKTIKFYINGSLMHTLIETTTPLCGSRHLRAFAKNTNVGVGTATVTQIQVMSISTWGKTQTQPKYNLTEGQTTGKILKVGIGSLHSINMSGIKNNANITLYDGTSTAGIKIYTTGAMVDKTEPATIEFNNGINFDNGLFIVIAGGNCNCQVIYE